MVWLVWLIRCLWLIGLIVLTAGLLTSEAATSTQDLVPEEAHFTTSKAVHFIAFLVMTVLLALSRWPRWVAWSGVGFLVLYACATEYLQQFVPFRTGTAFDVGIDCLGILFGLLVTYRIWLPKPAIPQSLPNRHGSAA